MSDSVVVSLSSLVRWSSTAAPSLGGSSFSGTSLEAKSLVTEPQQGSVNVTEAAGGPSASVLSGGSGSGGASGSGGSEGETSVAHAEALEAAATLRTQLQDESLDPLQRLGLEADLERAEALVESTVPRVRSVASPSSSSVGEQNDSNSAGSSSGSGGMKALGKRTQSPFPVNEELNKKIIHWRGDIQALAVDAIVIATNETMDQKAGLPGLIHLIAGPELGEAVAELEVVRTGEARMTFGYRLPAKHIVHTVAPRYHIKYKTAAENALHSCYRSSLELCKEGALASVAFSCIHAFKKDYPLDEGAHIAIRTVRRFLERFGSGLEAVVLCSDSIETAAVYEALLPLYFPRSVDEEALAVALLPEDTGNENGETVLAERRIRIGHLPRKGDDADEGETSILAEHEAAQLAFQTMDPDVLLLHPPEAEAGGEPPVPLTEEEELAEMNYKTRLAAAREMDFSDLKELNFIYRGGHDSLGRTICVFVGHHLPASEVDLERVMSYMMTVMEPFVDKHYVVVYVHTCVDWSNQIDLRWLQNLFTSVSRKYRKNLKASYILHPTFWLRMATWFLQSFVSAKFLAGLQYFNDLPSFWEYVPMDECPLPTFVIDYDYETNPQLYTSRPARASTSSSSVASSAFANQNL